MNPTHILLLLTLLFAGMGTITAQPITNRDMLAIYDEVKTPYKYGVIMKAPRKGDMVDCPSVFRLPGSDKWYMTYVLFDGRGYETWLSTSDDLLHWEPQGKLMSFTDSGWDMHQKGGFPSLPSMTWGGDYHLGTYDGKYWMTYIGSATRGYEGVPISIGLASLDAKEPFLQEWKREPEPVLAQWDKDTLWWESYSPYKSLVYEVKNPLGSRFLMFYNASYQGFEHPKGERIGLATSDDMIHWKRYEKNPVFQHSFNSCITGDAYIQKIGGLYVMFYFSAHDPRFPKYGGYNSFACSRDLVNWTDWEGEPIVTPSESYDAIYSHKSYVVKWKGVVYHYYCAVDKDYRRTIALATSKDMTTSNLPANISYTATPDNKALPKLPYPAVDSTAWSKVPFIAMEQTDTVIVPGIHLPLIKKQLGKRKVGTYTMPLFRKDFTCKKSGIASATLAICGLGHFEAYLNGAKVGNHFLDPGWTQYEKEAEYVVFDVKDMLHPGKDRLEIMLGNGFYNIPRERYTKLITSYGAPKVKALLHIIYKDGTSQDIPTDLTWKAAASPITFSSIYGGENFDARLSEEKALRWKKPLKADYSGLLKQQKGTAVTYHDTLQAVSVTSLGDNRWLYDFGQNASGIVSISVSGKAGDSIRITPGETLKDGKPYQIAKPYYWQYTLNGSGQESWQPRFTYYGFRYAMVEGIKPERVSMITTYSEAEEVGSFHCNNDFLNRIHTLIDWAIRSNTQSVSTDCPTREKLGWLEQSYLMQQSMSYRYDMRDMYRKIMSDIACSQQSDGMVPTTAPRYVIFDYGFDDSPEWSSVFVQAPWTYYEWYGDDSLIKQYYPAICRYVDYLTTKAENGIISYGLGDWYDLGPDRPGYAQLTSQGVTATATYYRNVQLLKKMAMMQGKREDLQKWSRLSKQIKKAYNEAFLHADSAYYDRGSQCANAISLCAGLVPDSLKAGVLANLVAGVERDNNTAGDIGFCYVLRALAEGGRSDVIFHMNNQQTKPGYGWQLAHGATALTESWQAYQNVSNNHLMLGHLMEWLYGYIGGIRQTEGSVGWKEILIDPHPVGDITSAETSLRCPFGTIRCQYDIHPDSYRIVVDVPQGTRAKVLLPDGTTRDATPGRWRFTERNAQ